MCKMLFLVPKTHYILCELRNAGKIISDFELTD